MIAFQSTKQGRLHVWVTTRGAPMEAALLRRFFSGTINVAGTVKTGLRSVRSALEWSGCPAVSLGPRQSFFALAYNVGRLFVLKTLDVSWHHHQVQTLRWKLYETAGKIVFHGGAIWLKVRHHLCHLFSAIRLQSWHFATG